MLNNLSLKTTIGWLRAFALLEGISFLVLLLIAMPLKYWYHQPLAVRIVGMIHGWLFLGYVILLFGYGIRQKWSKKELIISFLGSILPFGTFYADHTIFLKKQRILQGQTQDY